MKRSRFCWTCLGKLENGISAHCSVCLGMPSMPSDVANPWRPNIVVSFSWWHWKKYRKCTRVFRNRESLMDVGGHFLILKTSVDLRWNDGRYIHEKSEEGIVNANAITNPIMIFHGGLSSDTFEPLYFWLKGNPRLQALIEKCYLIAADSRLFSGGNQLGHINSNCKPMIAFWICSW